MSSVFEFVYFDHKVDHSKDLSFIEWLKERQMNAVLHELSKCNPETRYLYDKYLKKDIGWIQNKLNKHDIIYNYIKIINTTYIKSIIDDYETTGQYIRDTYNIHNAVDKKIILLILTRYIKISTNIYVYNELNEIINSIISTNNIIDSHLICNLLYNKLIHTYHPLIINDIIHYRSFIE